MIIKYTDEIKELSDKKTVVALGSFDALHIGHLRLIEKAKAIAEEQNCLLLVQLFEFPSNECINTLQKRLDILESMGVDAVVIEKFTEEFRKTDYKDFVEEYIKNRYNAGFVCAGYNYRFGYKALGDTQKLKEECLKYKIEVFVQDCVRLDRVVSSTTIREMIKMGDVEKAKEYMGRYYSLCGKVVKGRQLGRKMGFPTANIDLPKEIVIPLEGVYHTQLDIDGEKYDGVTNVGGKPTVAPDEKNCETHIIGYEGDLYGRKIVINFLKRLRDIKGFKNIAELENQLKKDISKVKKES